MRLSLRIANPAGNITIFVMNQIAPEKYFTIASKLLVLEQFKAEQVAFNVPPKMGGEGRIQMMGGEFCGNATRSFGYLLSSLSPEKPERISVEISGSDHPLEVVIDHQNSRCETQMPLPERIFSFEFEGAHYNAVVFDGIIHTIIEEKPKDERFVRDFFEKIKKELPCDAYGIMFFDGAQMLPVVYVCGTDSIIWESSCGSGSMAASVLMALKKQADGRFSFALPQPGGLIEAEVTVENQKVVGCKMGGPVSISEEIEIDI